MAAYLLCRVEWHFNGIESWNGPGATVLVVLVIALAAVFFINTEIRSRLKRNVRVPSLSGLAADSAGPDRGGAAAPGGARLQDFYSRKARRERRRALRREGNPVELLIADDRPGTTPINGQVMDRSRGGLLIAAHHEYPVGAVLSVRTTNAPNDLPWIQVEVKHCRQQGDGWQLGCKFTHELPWGILLFFG
jgi:hypothetical protein